MLKPVNGNSCYETYCWPALTAGQHNQLHKTMERYDDNIIYCRALGHQVPFKYCRKLKGEMPCGKIFDCWFETVNITEYMNSFYTEEEIQRIVEPPKPKVSSLVELIERAKTR